MMMQVYVDPAAAVRAGKATSGLVAFELTEGFLSSLSTEERDVLAEAITATSGWELGATMSDRAAGGGIPEATEEHVRAALARRAERRRAEKESREAERLRREAEYDALAARIVAEGPQEYLLRYGNRFLGPIIPGAVADRPEVQEIIRQAKVLRAEQEARQERFRQEREERLRAEREEAERREEEYRTAVSEFVRTYGDENQIQRQAAGVLPDEEAEGLVRNHLFAAGDSARLAKHSRIRPAHIPCECDYQEEQYEYDQEALSTLTAEQWEIAQQLRAAFPTARIEHRRHTGRCASCQAGTVTRYSALVTIDWHNRPFSRAYALPNPENEEDADTAEE